MAHSDLETSCSQQSHLCIHDVFTLREYLFLLSSFSRMCRSKELVRKLAQKTLETAYVSSRVPVPNKV